MMQLLEILAAIFIPYLIAGTIDFSFKEVTKRRLFARGGKWSEMPRWLMHGRGWHFYITSLWIFGYLLLVFVLNWPWQILLVWIAFYTEDVVYYLLTSLVYGGPYADKGLFPRQLYWLHGNIGWYKRIVGASFPRRNFLRVLALQYVLLALALLLAV